MSTDSEPVAAPETEPDDHGQPVVTIAGDCAQATGQVFNDGQLQVRAIGVRMMATGSAYVIVRPGQNGVVSLTLSPDWSALPAAAPANHDIVDEIDALVEEQMTGGEPLTGYFYGDPTYPKCPNPWCREPWHGLAITQRMARMRLLRTLDPSYRHADDASAVLCPGSLHTGEYTPPPDRWASVSPLVVQYQQRRWTAAQLDRFRRALQLVRDFRPRRRAEGGLVLWPPQAQLDRHRLCGRFRPRSLLAPNTETEQQRISDMGDRILVVLRDRGDWC